MNQKNDLLHGPIAKSLFLFALPILTGNLFQQFYNMVDSMIVGRFVGENALAAVGASYALTTVFISVAVGGGIGASVLTSRYLGAGDFENLRLSVHTSLVSFLVFSILLGTAGFFLSPAILQALNTPAVIQGQAVSYLRIYFLGLPFLFMYNVLSATFNALGRSRIPLYFLIFSSLLNVALDLFMVRVLKLAVAGVAAATVIAQGISAVLSFLVLLHLLREYRLKDRPAEVRNRPAEVKGRSAEVKNRPAEVRNRPAEVKNRPAEVRNRPAEVKDHPMEGSAGVPLFEWNYFLKMLRIAIPSILQQSIVSIGMMLVQSVVNGFGEAMLAGFSAAMRIESLCVVPLSAMGNAVSTFTAQNLGAKQVDRAQKGYRVSYGIVFAFAFIILIALELFHTPIIKSFLGEDSTPQALATGVAYLRFQGFFFVLLGLKMCTDGILRGAGDMKVFTLANLTNLGIRVLFAHIFAPIMGIQAVWIAVPVGWAANYIISFLRYRTGFWKHAASGL